MKTLKLHAFFGNNVGDDLMVKILLERYPQYRFYYAQDDVRSCIFLKYRNFDNKRKFYNRYSKLNRLLNLLTLGKRKDFLFDRLFQRKLAQCQCGVLIGGSMYMQLKVAPAVQLRWSEDNFGKLPRIVIGVNFGPYRDEEFREVFTGYFERCAAVTFRDKTSYGMFSHLPNTAYAPDVVLNLNTAPYQKQSSDNTVLISVIDMPYRPALVQWTQTYDQYIADCCAAAIRQGKTPVLVSFCKQEEDETAISRILKTLGPEIRNQTQTYFYTGDLDEVLRLFAGTDYVVATRFHAMILALCFHKPFFSISYSDKVKWVLDDIGCDAYCGLEQLAQMDADKMFDIYSQPINVDDYIRQAARQFEQFDRYMENEQN